LQYLGSAKSGETAMQVPGWLRVGLGVAALLLSPQTASAQHAASEARPARIPTADFTETSGLDGPEISPDGNWILLKAVRGGKGYLAVLDAATRGLVLSIALSDKSDLDWYNWAGNGRILIALSALDTLFAEEVRVTRLYVFDIATRGMSLVGKKTQGIDGDDVLFTDPAGQYVLLEMQRSIYDWPSVWRFPLDGTAEKAGVEVQKPKDGVVSWSTDDAGTVRLGFQIAGSSAVKILYRRSASDDFKAIGKFSEDSKEDDFWDVLRIVAGSDEGFALKPDDSGRLALRKFNYATRAAGETVFAVPGWDVDGFSLDDSNQPLAAWYTDERDRIAWFEPKMKKLQARLEKALKGSEVWIGSRAKDSSRAIVWQGGPDDPGVYYVFSADKSTLDVLYTNKPRLTPEVLAKPRAIAFKARDGAEIRGFLTLPRGLPPKALPLIVLPHGGPYGVRDKLDYDSEVQFLANRGYVVLQPNYRGSGGYGEAFEKLGDGQIGRAMQDDIDDATDWAVAQGYADPRRVCVVGASYGGYAALWAVIRNPERYRCAASFAGVTDWKKQIGYDRRFLSSKGSKARKAQVRGEDDKFDLDLVSPVAQVERLTRPVLLAHGEEDSNVPFKQYKLLRDAAAKAGKPLELLPFAEEGHGFDKPENQGKWLDTLEAFLARHNPAD
jgi:dipeptidyl aminopeptidase/acylaminoacyl peptidase